MSDRDDPPPSDVPAGQGSAPAGAGVVGEVATLLRALRASRRGRGLGLLAGGIVLVVCANTFGQIRLNTWQGAFYDALEQRNWAVFTHQLLVFAIIVAVLLVLVVAQTWLNRMVEVRLREWLTGDLLDEWLAPKRAYRLAFAGEIGVNPDQRIQEDTRRLCEHSADLGVGLLQASLLLGSFIGVLWMLSAQVVFTLGERSFTIPGYMVWCALAYALAGSWLTWHVGRPLIHLNDERYSREAEFRFSVVRTSELIEPIALYGGEAGERERLEQTVRDVVTIMSRLANGLARLTWITSGYGWLAIVVPILAAAPGYFGGSLSLGGLMMVVGAFMQVQQALRWYVDNFPRIADWRAALLRVSVFRDALLAAQTLGRDAGRIRLVEHPEGKLVFDDVSVLLPDGRAALEEARVEVSPGERLLIVSEAGSGKSMLFRALAGLWPWGAGTIHLPPRTDMMFMPQRPYFPLRTLRAALSYPDDPDAFADAATQAALDRLGLGHLRPDLDQEKRWDRELSLDEQQRLAFVRLLLHAPQWVFLDGATSAMDEDRRRTALSIFERELAGVAVIGVARMPARDGLYDRTVRLRHLPEPAPLSLKVPAQPARGGQPAGAHASGGPASVPDDGA